MEKFREGLRIAGLLTCRMVLQAFFCLGFLIVLQGNTEGEWVFNRAQRRYNDCVTLYEDRRLDEARQCVAEFFADYPDSRWVEHLQFLDAEMECDVEHALVKWRRFLIEFPNGPYSAQANFDIGEIYELMGDFPSAFTHYSRVCEYLAPNELCDEAGLRMIRCALLEGRLDSARELVRDYLSSHQNDPWRGRARELHADVLYESGQFSEAQQEYKAVISECSGASPRCYLRISEIYEKTGDDTSALQAYQQFLSHFPEAVQRPMVEAKLAELASRLGTDISFRRGSYVVEAGSFKSDGEALALIARLKKLGYNAYLVKRSGEVELAYSVRLGSYESRDLALTVVGRLKEEAGLDASVLPQGGTF
ncbi:MAG: hypothetical protein Kow0099_00470 [Candidatus Abyssubacteria bacterium]